MNRILRSAGLLGLFFTGLWPAPARAAGNWLPLREIQRLFRPAPREVLLLASPSESAAAGEIRRRLSESGYAVEEGIAAQGPCAFSGILDIAQIRSSVPPVVAVLPGPDNASCGMSKEEHAGAVEALADSLISRGAYPATIVVALPRPPTGMPPGYRLEALRVARERDMLLLDIPHEEAEEAKGAALARAVLSSRWPHPSLYGLLIYPLASLALLWLRYRSRFRAAKS